MATIIASQYSFLMNTLSFSPVYMGGASSSNFILGNVPQPGNSSAYIRFNGAMVSQGGDLMGGTITSLDIVSTSYAARVSGLNADALTICEFAEAGNWSLLWSTLLQGADRIQGTGLDDLLWGYDGNDTLIGGVGLDTMEGGAGNDLYVVDQRREHVTELADAGTDTVQSSVTFTLPAFVENLTITGGSALTGKGNALGNLLVGNSGNNLLQGLAGDDTLLGAAGNDTLDGGVDIDSVSYLGAASQVVVNLALTTAQNTRGAGTDTLRNIENVIGGSAGDVLTGSAVDNILTGGAGNDTLNGGLGRDTASYSHATSQVVVNLALTTAQNTRAAGTDTLSNIEDVIGGSAGDVLTGSTGNNSLSGGAGNDTLDGGAGTDTVSYADAISKVVVNLALTTAQNTRAAGTDTLRNLENIIGGNVGDHLSGNAAGNRIDGGLGADTMVGAAGNDTYVVDNVGDKTVELQRGGTDTVVSSITWLLGGCLENLTLTGTDNISGTGNDNHPAIGGSGNNIIIGNAGNNVLDGKGGSDSLTGGAGDDTLIGGAGNDSLTGGEGDDVFSFSTAPIHTDTITYFDVVDDMISLSLGEFFEIVASTDPYFCEMFVIGNSALDANDHLIYKATSGALYYDPDGNGADAQIMFASLDPNLNLSVANFLVG